MNKAKKTSKFLFFIKNITLSFFLPLFVMLVLWLIASYSINSPLILPKPILVFDSLIQLFQTSSFWEHLLATTGRTLYSFFISLVISLFLGTIIGFYKPIAQFFSFIMAIIKTTPVVSFILLAIFWFSTNMVNVFIGVLMTLPIMTGAIANGIKNIDPKLIAMSNVYQFTKKQKAQFIYIPQIVPFFMSGCLNAFSLSWKVVVAAEVLVLPKNGIGTALHLSKTHIETADVFAYTIAVILVSFMLEQLLSLLLQSKKGCAK